MNSPRSLAPFWAVDVVGLVVVGVLCAVGKVGADTTVAIIVAVLGLGAVSRVRRQDPPDPPDPPPNNEAAPTTQRGRRSRPSIPVGGLVGLVYALGHVRS